jgi:hypothetical protein
MEDRDGYLDRLLIGGREPVKVGIVEYDDRWPLIYAAMASRIRKALQDRVLRLGYPGAPVAGGSNVSSGEDGCQNVAIALRGPPACAQHRGMTDPRRGGLFRFCRRAPVADVRGDGWMAT